MDFKKELEIALTIYSLEKHTQEECTGFIAGFEALQSKVNNVVLDAVSGSLSAEECEKLIYYGKLESKGIVLDDEKKHLDYVLLRAFDLLKEKTVFDVEEAKKMFWKRIKALANYR